MVCWGFFTLGNAFVTNTKQLFVIRFFQTCMESATFVGTHYVLGSWYKFEELGKRTANFISAGIAGTMFSGILQGAVYRNLSELAPIKQPT
jgi:ACS family pantothenate transporter-like MFS transporter